jgi:WD40 repeat protein
LRVWDLETGDSRELVGHTDGVKAIVVTPDGRRAVSGSDDKTMRVWDLETGDSRELVGHTDDIKAIVVTPDGRRAISTSWKTLRVWNLETSRYRELDANGWARAIAVTPDGRHAVSGSIYSDPGLRVWNVETGRSRVLERHEHFVESVVVTPDGRRAVSCGGERYCSNDKRSLCVWELQTGHSRLLEGHTRGVKAVAVTPDGRRVVFGGDDGTLRVWDLGTGRSRVIAIEGDRGCVRGLAVTPDGRHVVSRSSSLSVWDLEKGESVAFYASPTGRVTSFGQRLPMLVAGTSTGRVELLHIVVGAHEHLLLGPRITTAERLWLYAPGVNGGCWDATLTATCDACGQRFPAAAAVIVAITAITRNSNLDDDSLCLGLPAEAWDEPRLLSECPLCHEPLKFNPFVVDNRDRYPAP